MNSHDDKREYAHRRAANRPFSLRPGVHGRRCLSLQNSNRIYRPAADSRANAFAAGWTRRIGFLNALHDGDPTSGVS